MRKTDRESNQEQNKNIAGEGSRESFTENKEEWDPRAQTKQNGKGPKNRYTEPKESSIEQSGSNSTAKRKQKSNVAAGELARQPLRRRK